jgi:hypothetical protein
MLFDLKFQVFQLGPFHADPISGTAAPSCRNLAERKSKASRQRARRAASGCAKRADIHEAFLSLGCALICWQSLRKELDDGLSA